MPVTYTKRMGSTITHQGDIPTFQEAYARLQSLDASKDVNVLATITDESGEQLAHAIVNPPGIHGGYKSMGLTRVGDDRAKAEGWKPAI